MKVGEGGVPLPNRLEGLRSVVSSQRRPGRSPGPGRQRVFGIFGAYTTLLVERTVLPY